MNKYIIFEGADGTGKTVLSQNYAKSLGAFWTCEPYQYNAETRSLRKKALTLDINKITREYYILANRSIGFKNISQILETKVVVSDRGFISGAVFASMEGFSFSDWQQMAHPIIDKIEEYNPIFILCENKKFKNKRNPDDRYDTKPISFHRTVAERFHKAFKYFELPYTKFEIDFNKSPEENLAALYILS